MLNTSAHIPLATKLPNMAVLCGKRGRQTVVCCAYEEEEIGLVNIGLISVTAMPRLILGKAEIDELFRYTQSKVIHTFSMMVFMFSIGR